jgi:hypothetical protein
VPSAARHARATSGTRLSLGSATTWQFRDSFTPDRRDNAKLGEVRSDRINHRGLLADVQMACAVKHQAALLLRRLCWHEPHVGSGDRFANSLSVAMSFFCRLR